MIVIIGGGPSLTHKDVSLCEGAGLTLLGINNAYQIATLDYLYACDTKWWQAHPDAVKIDAEKYSLKAKPSDKGIKGVKQMQRGERQGLSKKWPVLNTSGNSGYQAINLAYLLGYTEMILLGFDMQLTNDRAHWHEDHGNGLSNPVEHTFRNWKRDFKTLYNDLVAENIKVFNATRETALPYFKRVPLEHFI